MFKNLKTHKNIKPIFFQNLGSSSPGRLGARREIGVANSDVNTNRIGLSVAPEQTKQSGETS